MTDPWMHDWATQQAAAGMAAAIPAAAGVAASGLYSTWVNYRKPPPPLTEPLEHLRTMGHSIFKRYDKEHLEWEAENARAQQRYAEAARPFSNDNFNALNAYWNAQVKAIFEDPYLSSYTRPEHRPSAISARLGLHNGFKKWFREDQFDSTNMEDAKKAIRTRIEELKRFAR